MLQQTCFVEITTIVANFKPFSFSVFGTVSSQFIVYKNPHTYTLRGPKLMIDIFWAWRTLLMIKFLVNHLVAYFSKRNNKNKREKNVLVTGPETHMMNIEKKYQMTAFSRHEAPLKRGSPALETRYARRRRMRRRGERGCEHSKIRNQDRTMFLTCRRRGSVGRQ